MAIRFTSSRVVGASRLGSFLSISRRGGSTVGTIATIALVGVVGYMALTGNTLCSLIGSCTGGSCATTESADVTGVSAGGSCSITGEFSSVALVEDGDVSGASAILPVSAGEPRYVMLGSGHGVVLPAVFVNDSLGSALGVVPVCCASKGLQSAGLSCGKSGSACGASSVGTVGSAGAFPSCHGRSSCGKRAVGDADWSKAVSSVQAFRRALIGTTGESTSAVMESEPDEVEADDTDGDGDA